MRHMTQAVPARESRPRTPGGSRRPAVKHGAPRGSSPGPGICQRRRASKCTAMRNRLCHIPLFPLLSASPCGRQCRPSSADPLAGFQLQIVMQFAMQDIGQVADTRADLRADPRVPMNRHLSRTHVRLQRSLQRNLQRNLHAQETCAFRIAPRSIAPSAESGREMIIKSRRPQSPPASRLACRKAAGPARAEPRGWARAARARAAGSAAPPQCRRSGRH